MTSGSLRRGLSRDAAVYATGDVATKALGFIAVPIYTRVFDRETFSSIAFLTTVGALLSSVLVLGGDSVLSRFWFRDATVDGTRRLVATWLGFLALVSTVVVLLLLPLSGVLSRALLEKDGSGAAVALLLIALPVSITSRMLGQVLRSQFRPLPYSASSFGVAVLGLGLGLVLAVRADLGLAGIFGGLLAAEVVVLLCRAVLCRRVLGGRPDPAMLPALLRFGLPLVPVTLSFFVFTASDRIVVGKLAGFDELAPYSVAVSLASIVALFCSAVGQAWVPRATQLYEADRDRAAVAFGQALTWYVTLLGCVAVGVSALSPQLFALVAPEDYASGARLLPVLVLAAMAYGSQLFTSGGLTMTQRTQRLAVISVLAAVLNLALSLTLVPLVGAAGAGVSNVVGFTVLTVAYHQASQRAWAITLERRQLVVATVALLAGTLVFTTPWDPPLALRLVAPLAFLAVVVRSDPARADLFRVSLSRLLHSARRSDQ